MIGGSVKGDRSNIARFRRNTLCCQRLRVIGPISFNCPPVFLCVFAPRRLCVKRCGRRSRDDFNTKPQSPVSQVRSFAFRRLAQCRPGQEPRKTRNTRKESETRTGGRRGNGDVPCNDECRKSNDERSPKSQIDASPSALAPFRSQLPASNSRVSASRSPISELPAPIFTGGLAPFRSHLPTPNSQLPFPPARPDLPSPNSVSPPRQRVTSN